MSLNKSLFEASLLGLTLLKGKAKNPPWLRSLKYFVFFTVCGETMKFSVVIERDEDGYYVAHVSELPGCHTQAKTLDELLERIKEAIELHLEVEGLSTEMRRELVGIQFIEIGVSEPKTRSSR
jgi:predicted RNase H-like HicB family nuclease